jgi:hypothetical protein
MESASVPATPDLAHTPRLTPGRVLAGLAVGWIVCLALIPLQIDRAFGLPAHPLLLHVPVVLGPLLAVVTVALALKSDWRRRYGLAWGALAVVTLLGTVLTTGAGEALYDDRFGGRTGAGGGAGIAGLVRLGGGTIADHRSAGETLRILMFVFVALILVVLLVDHLRATGRRAVPGVAVTALLAVTSLVGLGAGFFVVRTGHLGAQATWRMQGGPPSGGGFPGGGQGGPGGQQGGGAQGAPNGTGATQGGGGGTPAP